MSTKIYNAYKVESCYCIDDVIKSLIKTRELYHKHIVDYLAGDYDNIKNRNGITNVYGLSQILKDDIVDQGIFDYTASVVLYVNKGCVYIQFFGFDNKTFDEVVKPVFGRMMVDYHYQNQSDPWYEYEENLTPDKRLLYDKEYEERRIVWEEIFGDDYVPSSRGLSYDFYTKSDVIHIVYDVKDELDSGE